MQVGNGGILIQNGEHIQKRGAASLAESRDVCPLHEAEKCRRNGGPGSQRMDDQDRTLLPTACRGGRSRRSVLATSLLNRREKTAVGKRWLIGPDGELPEAGTEADPLPHWFENQSL